MIIHAVIVEGGLWSGCGVTSQEIRGNAAVSQRALLYAPKRMRGLSLLKETKFGAFTYHKLSGEFREKR